MTTANVPATISNFRQAVSKYKATAPRARGGVGYLNYSKGDWTFGRERKPLDLDTMWVIDPASIEHGFICWRNGKIFREVLIPFTSVLPAEHTLPEPPEPEPGSDDSAGYQYQVGFTCVCVEGAHTGEQMQFKSASVGGTGAIQSMIDDLEARLEEAEETGNPAVYPVVQFGSDHYMHKTRGKIFVPIIEVMGFSENEPGCEIEWLDADEEPEPEPEPVVEKTKLRRTAAKK